jgi:hypothetical protein
MDSGNAMVIWITNWTHILKVNFCVLVTPCSGFRTDNDNDIVTTQITKYCAVKAVWVNTRRLTLMKSNENKGCANDAHTGGDVEPKSRSTKIIDLKINKIAFVHSHLLITLLQNVHSA